LPRAVIIQIDGKQNLFVHNIPLRGFHALGLIANAHKQAKPVTFPKLISIPSHRCSTSVLYKQARPCQDGLPLSLQRLKFSFTLASPRTLNDIATAGVNKAAAIIVLAHQEDDNPGNRRLRRGNQSESVAGPGRPEKPPEDWKTEPWHPPINVKVPVLDSHFSRPG
jgi:hypothetical protein